MWQLPLGSICTHSRSDVQSAIPRDSYRFPEIPIESNRFLELLGIPKDS